jgi:hypothetical protein
MKRLLQAGDRVIVIAGDPCCGNDVDVGKIFTVGCITEKIRGKCGRCSALFDEIIVWPNVPNGDGTSIGYLLETLQWIPPETKVIKERMTIDA